MTPVKALGLAVALFAAAAGAEDPKKDDPANAAAQKAHEFLAASRFNACWTLIDKPDRSAKETEDMLLPFHVGYAYEALARAEVLHRDFAAARGHLAKARQLLGRVTDKEEKELLGTDLAELGKKFPTAPQSGGAQP